MGGVVGSIGLTVLIGFVILARFLVVFLVFKQKVRGVLGMSVGPGRLWLKCHLLFYSFIPKK